MQNIGTCWTLSGPCAQLAHVSGSTGATGQYDTQI